MKLLLIIMLTACLGTAFAQRPEAVLGTWKGPLVQYNGKNSISGDITISLNKVDGKLLSGTLLYANMSNKMKDRQYPVQMWYVYENGGIQLQMPFANVINNSRKISNGMLLMDVVQYNGKLSLSSHFVPTNKEDDAGKIDFTATLEPLNNTYPSSNEVTTAVNSTWKIGSSPAISNVKAVGTAKPNEEKAEALSPGAKLLFKGVKSKLTVAEKNLIFENTPFIITKDAQKFALKSIPDHPFGFETHVLDLTNDDIEEVFISYGDVTTSGMAGSSIMAFTRQQYGTYKLSFDRSGLLPNVIHAAGPAIVIGGPGFNYPVYWWIGGSFQEDMISSEKLKEHRMLELTELEDLYVQGGSKAVAERMGKLRLEDMDLKYKRIDDAKALIAKRAAEQKGKVGKFLGKWWELGYFDNPFTLTKVGEYYVLSSKRQQPYTGMKFTFNAKLDRLEGWLSTPDLKVRVVVNYLYEKDKLEIKQLAGGRGMPGYLMRYK